MLRLRPSKVDGNYERFVILIYIAHEHQFNQRQMIFYEGKETKNFDISFTSYLLTSEVDAYNHTRPPLLDLNPIYAEMFMPIEVRQYRRRRHARGNEIHTFMSLMEATRVLILNLVLKPSHLLRVVLQLALSALRSSSFKFHGFSSRSDKAWVVGLHDLPFSKSARFYIYHCSLRTTLHLARHKTGVRLNWQANQEQGNII